MQSTVRNLKATLLLSICATNLVWAQENNKELQEHIKNLESFRTHVCPSNAKEQKIVELKSRVTKYWISHLKTEKSKLRMEGLRSALGIEYLGLNFLFKNDNEPSGFINAAHKDMEKLQSAEVVYNEDIERLKKDEAAFLSSLLNMLIASFDANYVERIKDLKVISSFNKDWDLGVQLPVMNDDGKLSQFYFVMSLVDSLGSKEVGSGESFEVRSARMDAVRSSKLFPISSKETIWNCSYEPTVEVSYREANQ